MNKIDRILIVPELEENEWHKRRREKICGSDVAVIMGLNKYRTIMDLIKDKKDGIVQEKNLAMKRGLALEGLIAEEYEKSRGIRVERMGRRFFEYDIFGGTIDAIGIDNNGGLKLLEFKTYSGAGLDKYLDENVEVHRVQLLFYWYLLEKIFGNYFIDNAGIVYLLNNNLVEVPVEYDLNRIDEIIGRCREFYTRYLLNGEEYRQEEMERANEDRIKEIDITIELKQMVEKRNKLLEMKMILEDQIKAIDEDIKNMIGINTIVRDGTEKIIEYRQNEMRRFDVERFKQDHIELYLKYLKTSIVSRLTIKKERNNEI